MRAVPAVALALALLAPISASAYSQRDASACMWDAFRLCSSAIPNIPQITRCLYVKRPQLSSACAEAFARNERTGAHRRHRHSVIVEN